MKSTTTASLFPCSKASKFRRNREKMRRAEIVRELPGYAVNTDPLFTQNEAAAYLYLSPKTLAKWRCQYPDRLPHLKIGGSVRYRKSALDAFLEASTVTDGRGVKK